VARSRGGGFAVEEAVEEVVVVDVGAVADLAAGLRPWCLSATTCALKPSKSVYVLFSSAMSRSSAGMFGSGSDARVVHQFELKEKRSIECVIGGIPVGHRKMGCAHL
jgi:hypothetical protein